MSISELVGHDGSRKNHLLDLGEQVARLMQGDENNTTAIGAIAKIDKQVAIENHIVPVVEVKEIDGRVYYVCPKMPFSLDQCKGDLDFGEIVRQMEIAIDFLASIGVSQGDVAKWNIWFRLDEKGARQYFLGDYSQAKKSENRLERLVWKSRDKRKLKEL